jgi:hypothetical protein
MSTITREFAESFFLALSTREPATIAPFVADDAEWLIVGPIELFPYCGQHLGKPAVLAAYARLHEKNNALGSEREFMITDGESASALTRLTAMQRSTGQVATIRLAQFARFRDGKAYEFCSIIDTLGAVEQLMGRPLVDLTADAPALVEG